MHFEILGEIQWIETIALGRSIRELRRLNRIYGKTTWRKRKGIAKIRLKDGAARLAELHSYEGHGKRRKETKSPFDSILGGNAHGKDESDGLPYIFCISSAPDAESRY